MGKASRAKRLRREARRELERAANDPRHRQDVEDAVRSLRAECYYVVARKVDDALRELYGFGDKRLARVWAHVKASAMWEPYMEQAARIDEAVGR